MSGVRLMIFPTPSRRAVPSVAQGLEPERGSVEEGAEKSKGAVSKSGVPLTGDRGFESVSLQRRVCELSVPTSFSRVIGSTTTTRFV
jgi:hypothetical protein